MVVVAPDGKIRFIEMLAFHEPEDYLPSPRWLDLFEDRPLTDDLWVKRGLRNIGGATITARAVTGGSRRILAAFEILIKESGK